MKALFFIAAQNLKKKKGDGLVLFFLILLASLLLYTSLSVFMGMNTVLDNAYDNAHSADFFLMTNVDEEKVAAILKAQEEVVEYEASQCIYLLDVNYRKAGEEDSKQGQFLFGNIQEQRTIGKLAGCENIQVEYNSIVLPYYMKASKEFKEGDICYFTLGNKEYEFKVAGFVQDPLFGTPLNISIYSAYISNECMEDLLEKNDIVKASSYMQHKTRLKEGEDSFVFDNRIIPIINKEIPELSESVCLGINWTSMKDGVAIMSQISMCILLVFSIILIAIVLIVIRFSIHNYIEMNLKNIGILQAAGYTARQLTISVILEMVMITIFAEFIGLALGVAGSSMIGQFQGNMLGISWNQTFHLGAAGITAIALLLIVVCVAYFSGIIYKKISVLESLRGGIHTHNFKKNYFEFSESKLPVSLILAGKNIMLEKAKNLSIFFIIALISFATCVGFGLYENFVMNTEYLLKLLGSETGNAMISGDDLEIIGKDMEKWEQIEEVLYGTTDTITVESEVEKTSVSCDVWKNPEQIHNEIVVKGRLPKYGNEIVLTTSIAKVLKVDVGDVIYVTGQGERKDYVVCGIDQKIHNMGLKAMLNSAGLERLNGKSKYGAVYIYTKEHVTFEEISKKITEKFPQVSVTDYNKIVDNGLKSVKLALGAICLIFVLITVFVVAIVEILLVKTKVIRERKNTGLNKAFGFTTRQLMIQTIMMNLPVITAGAIVGVCLSCYLIEPLIVTCLSFSGIKQCDFIINITWMVITVALVILVAIMASFISAVKIRKIEPIKMLTEE